MRIDSAHCGSHEPDSDNEDRMNKLQKQRARLIREADALRTADGKFADDAARQAFDAKMAEVDAIDVQLRGLSETIAEESPFDSPAPRPTDEDPEPNERDEAIAEERTRCQGIMLACR